MIGLLTSLLIWVAVWLLLYQLKLNFFLGMFVLALACILTIMTSFKTAKWRWVGLLCNFFIPLLIIIVTGRVDDILSAGEVRGIWLMQAQWIWFFSVASFALLHVSKRKSRGR